MSLLHRASTERLVPTTRRRLSRTAAGLGIASLALIALPLTASSAIAADTDPALIGLYGTSDPTYDGVFRQSLGILGILAAGDEPVDEAVTWLLDQQCDDGGFMAFNPDPSADCIAPDPVNFAGEDTNSTALAAQALAGVGAIGESAAALAFLEAARNKDGGWPYIPGGDSDPNSTGLVLTALTTGGDAVDQDAVDYLAGIQLGCPDAAEDQGGITSPFSGGAPDILATVQAVPGVAGFSLLDGPASAATWIDDAPAFTCPVDNSDSGTVAGWGSAWLEAQATVDAINAGNAPWAVLSFAATRTGLEEAQALFADIDSSLGKAPKLKSSEVSLAAQSDENPGALGLAALAGATLDETTEVEGFASRIAATITAAPTVEPSPEPTPAPSSGSGVDSDGETLPDSGTDPLLALIGFTLLASGAGLVLGTRRRQQTGATDA